MHDDHCYRYSFQLPLLRQAFCTQPTQRALQARRDPPYRILSVLLSGSQAGGIPATEGYRGWRPCIGQKIAPEEGAANPAKRDSRGFCYASGYLPTYIRNTARNSPRNTAACNPHFRGSEGILGRYRADRGIRPFQVGGSGQFGWRADPGISPAQVRLGAPMSQRARADTSARRATATRPPAWVTGATLPSVR